MAGYRSKAGPMSPSRTLSMRSTRKMLGFGSFTYAPRHDAARAAIDRHCAWCGERPPMAGMREGASGVRPSSL